MIPVIINNRDLLTWTRAMLKKIKQLDNIGEIIIVDNDSSYKPLLDWYKTAPCRIVRTRNFGREGPWKAGVIDTIPYVVTDPDLGIDELPIDTLTVLQNKLRQNPSLEKVGLGLDWERVGTDSPYYKFLQSHEKGRWKKSRIVDGVYIDVAIDTTFAMYNTPDFFIGGGSMGRPYIARHYPWELTLDEVHNNKEFSYYLKGANSSCSYKRFLHLS